MRCKPVSRQLHFQTWQEWLGSRSFANIKKQTAGQFYDLTEWVKDGETKSKVKFRYLISMKIHLAGLYNTSIQNKRNPHGEPNVLLTAAEIQIFAFPLILLKLKYLQETPAFLLTSLLFLRAQSF